MICAEGNLSLKRKIMARSRRVSTVRYNEKKHKKSGRTTKFLAPFSLPWVHITLGWKSHYKQLYTLSTRLSTHLESICHSVFHIFHKVIHTPQMKMSPWWKKSASLHKNSKLTVIAKKVRTWQVMQDICRCVGRGSGAAEGSRVTWETKKRPLRDAKKK